MRNFISLTIWNSGDTDVKIWNKDDNNIDDFEIPISFHFGRRTVISLTSCITNPHRRVIEQRHLKEYLVNPSPDGHSIALPHCMLKPNQSISLSILVKGPRGMISQKGQLFSGTITEFNPQRDKENLRRQFPWFFNNLSTLSLIGVTVLALGCLVLAALVFSNTSQSSPPVFVTPLGSSVSLGKIEIDTSGNITLALKHNIISSLGTYPISVKSPYPLKTLKDSFLLIIRHKHSNSFVDTVYKVPSNINVNSDIGYETVEQDVLLVDAIGGTSNSIELTT